MKVKRLGLVLVAVGFFVGCGEADLNKDFKPTTKDTPMPTAAGAGPAGQVSAPTPP